jgi:hypothetical protein
MNKVIEYSKWHWMTIMVFIVYCLLWLPLLLWLFTGIELYQPVIIGEFPFAPILTIPFIIIMLLNAAFRKQHKLFYLIMAAVIYMPFFLLSLNE